jgi:hypothetical protein
VVVVVVVLVLVLVLVAVVVLAVLVFKETMACSKWSFPGPLPSLLRWLGYRLLRQPS